METEKLNELTEYLLEAVKSGGEYVKETAPEFITELMTYDYTIAKIWLIVASVCWVISTLLFILSLTSDEAEEISPFVFGLGCIFLVPIILNASTMIKITIAPKVYIFDYLQGLIN